MLIKSIIKNPFTIWVQWLIHSQQIKNKFPTSKLHYMAFARQSKLGEYVTVYGNSNINQCEIGDYTYIAAQSTLLNTCVGRFCSIGPGVRCGLGRHPVDYVSTHPMFFSTAKQAQITFADNLYYEELLPIEIGSDVWIGANAVILDGVKIGDGAIIAAGAVVNKDVSPYAIVGGVPARVIKYRFTPDEVEVLLNFKWWDKDYEWIKANWRLWHDVKTFIHNVRNELK